MQKYLKKQKLTPESIPKKDEKVILGNLIALWAGGVLRDVSPTKIPQKNHDLFQKVLSTFEARIFGLDFICEKSIEIPWDKQKCIFLEANSRPYLKMHAFPRGGTVPDFSSDLKKLESMANPDADIF